MSLEDVRLGNCQLDGEIGRGTLGVVYRGTHASLGRQVAVKVLDAHLTEEMDFVRRFVREARAATRLRHPNLVTIYGIGEQGGQYFVVMEYVKGHSLSRVLLEQDRLSHDEALSLLRQLADVLDFVHSKGLIHLDLTPSNVMVDPDRTVKLCDLSVTRAALESGLAARGITLGTPQYVSPEQARDKPVGPKADLYSLAVIAYELLTGARPFDGGSAPAILYKQVSEPPPSIVSRNTDLATAVDEVFQRALAKEPERRYASAADFVESLARALKGSQVPATAPRPAEASQLPMATPASAAALGLAAPRGQIVPSVWLAAGALMIILVLFGVLVASGLFTRPRASSLPGASATVVPSQVPVDALIDTIAPVAATDVPGEEPTITHAALDSTDTPVAASSSSTPAAIPEMPTDTPSRTGAMPSDTPAPGVQAGNTATVKIPVADVLSAPDPTAERVTQLVMGEKVLVLQTQDGWYEIAAVDQPSPLNPLGYPGWIKTDVVSWEPFAPTVMAIVMVPTAALRTNPNADASILAELSIDSRLDVNATEDDWVAVALPDGQTGWLSQEEVRLVCPGEECPDGLGAEADKPRPANEILATAVRFIGTPYLWGGTSSTALDCSGFVYRVLHANGIAVPRDSRPMSEGGNSVERRDLQPGDIVFIAQGGPSGRVSHCALYIGQGEIITTMGSDPIAVVPLDEGRYRDDYWGAKRYP